MGRLIGYTISIPVILLSISVVLNFILAALLTLTYSTLTDEKLVASLTFSKPENSKGIYIGTLLDEDGDEIGEYEIYGNQWRIDASFIKMEYMANILGVDSKYTLDRFEGRYKSVNDQNSKVNKSYQLEGKDVVEYFSWFVDVTYGSSTYKDIKLNTLYSVLKSPTGLLVREKQLNNVVEKGYFEQLKELVSF